MKLFWPFMLKSTHTKEVLAVCKEYQDSLDYANGVNAKERECLNKLVAKLIHVTVQPDRHTQTFQVCVSWSEQMVHDALIHGHQDEMLDYLVNSMMYSIKAAVKSINFYRRT